MLELKETPRVDEASGKFVLDAIASWDKDETSGTNVLELTDASRVNDAPWEVKTDDELSAENTVDEGMDTKVELAWS